MLLPPVPPSRTTGSMLCAATGCAACQRAASSVTNCAAFNGTTRASGLKLSRNSTSLSSCAIWSPTSTSQRRRWDVLVGDQIAHDDKLVLFLESFSPDARVVPLNAAQFVTELAARWHAAHPVAAQSIEPVVREGGTGGRSIPNGSIFVSYA